MHINGTSGAERDARQASVGVDAPDIHYSAPTWINCLLPPCHARSAFLSFNKSHLVAILIELK